MGWAVKGPERASQVDRRQRDGHKVGRCGGGAHAERAHDRSNVRAGKEVVFTFVMSDEILVPIDEKLKFASF
jgi:hypothetical protein